MYLRIKTNVNVMLTGIRPNKINGKNETVINSHKYSNLDMDKGPEWSEGLRFPLIDESKDLLISETLMF